MLLPNRYSFSIVRKKDHLRKDDNFISHAVENVSIDKKENYIDDEKRDFLKILGSVGVGAAVLGMLPNKAQALIIGSSPTAGMVGVKNTSNTSVNPATEDGNLATIASKDFATETTLGTLVTKDFATQTTLAAVKTNTDKFQFDVDGKLLTSGSASTSIKLQDSSNNIINPATDENLILLRRILRQIDSLAVVDSAQRQKVTLDAITGGLTLGAITTVTTVSTVTNVATLGAVDARYLYIDTARNAYANGVRNNLIYS